jgi:hypothetical protein
MNMSSESFEPVKPTHAFAMTGSRRSPSKAAGSGKSTAPGDVLLPHVVDEAFADETTTVAPQRGSRRDLVGPTGTLHSGLHKIDVPHVTQPADVVSDAQASRMMQSLGRQIDAIRAQQEQIRRLIEQVEQYAVGEAR